MQLHWHRSDLRAMDNVGLTEATADGPVVPVFVFDEQALADSSPPRVTALLDALTRLRNWYRDRGSELVIVHGDPQEKIPHLATEYDAERVTWNREYSRRAKKRDAAVRQALDEQGIARASFDGGVHHEPGAITTNAGDPYAVYTYFWKKWRDRPKEPPREPPSAAELASVEDNEPLPTRSELGFEQPEAEVQPVGPAPARERLEVFCSGPIFEYDEKRDYPTAECTSRLSADIAFGTIGVRELYAATEDAMQAAETESAAESVEEFQSQLAWREFYIQVLDDNPDVVSENYKEYENEIQWRDDPEALQAWKDGNTGYPIVDAGMRQLREEAYMHNRVRMIVASFLTKDLLIDWRKGYAWFKQKLADHNIANNNGGWQWAASTGTDAQPYFRIFNPMTQGERYDPDAEYITQYVPELEGVDPEVIHEWHECSLTQRRRAAPEYPDPIVDHGDRREKALSMFKRARGEED